MNRAFVGLLMTVVLFAFAGIALAQGEGKAPEDMQKMMADWQKWMNPGPEHELLKKLEGDWTGACKWWMGPDTEPMQSTMTTVGVPFFGGRFVKMDQSSEMMGMTINGMVLIGYDKFKQKYNLLYVDDGGTAMYTALGTLDESGKILTFIGKVDEPMTGEKDKDNKYVYRFNDDGSFTFEIWDTPTGGTEFKAAELTFTKK